VRADRNVLNIGVGKGHCTRNLAKRGCKVSVLDISPVAVANVQEVITAGYLASDLDQIPPNHFDLAISFLVAQHMAHAGLEAQFAAVVRSLKPRGLFAMQYGAPMDSGVETTSDEPLFCKEGGVKRSPEYMEAMVRKVGGKVLRSWLHSEYPQYGIAWWILHVAKP